MFGLQPNASLAVASEESAELQSLFLRVQPKRKPPSEAKGSTSFGASSAEMSALADTLLEQLPTEFDCEEAFRYRPPEYLAVMNSSLHQELARYNALLKVTRKTFQKLKVGGARGGKGNRQEMAINCESRRRVGVYTPRTPPALLDGVH